MISYHFFVRISAMWGAKSAKTSSYSRFCLKRICYCKKNHNFKAKFKILTQPNYCFATFRSTGRSFAIIVVFATPLMKASSSGLYFQHQPRVTPSHHRHSNRLNPIALRRRFLERRWFDPIPPLSAPASSNVQSIRRRLNNYWRRQSEI